MPRRSVGEDRYVPNIRRHNAKVPFASDARKTECQDGNQSRIDTLSEAV